MIGLLYPTIVLPIGISSFNLLQFLNIKITPKSFLERYQKL